MSKRKIILGVIVLFSVFLMTGCGISKEAVEDLIKEAEKLTEQKLYCKANANGVDVAFDITYKGNSISSMILTYEMDLSKYTDVQIEALKSKDFCATVKESLSEYKNAFKNCNQNIANKKLLVKSDLDINTMSTKSGFGTINDAKSGLESAGYACTID